MKFGRQPNLGEKGVADLVDQRNVLNRTIRAQVTSVGNDDGFVTVTYDSLPSGGRYATVAPLWASFPEIGGAAWGRFMPQPSDVVKLSFDYDDRPHIVGFDIVAGKPGVADGRSGWPQINGLHKTAKANPDAKVEVNRDGTTKSVSIAKYAQFNPLNPGEFDFMSSGGAYIYGTNRGKLYMAGGSVSISLVKNDLALLSNAQMWAHKADDCDFRFGQVRRTGVTQLEAVVPTDPAGRLKEFRATLKNTIAPGKSLDVAAFEIGNIVSSIGSIEFGPMGMALRYLSRSYNDLGMEVHRSSVDTNGNNVIESLSGSVKFDLSAGSFTVQSPTIKFEGPKGALPAIHPLLMTQVYRLAEDVVITTLAAQIAALSAQVAILAGAIVAIGATLQAGGAASTPPVVGAIAMGKIFQGASAAITALATPVVAGAPLVGTAATGAATAFTGPGQTYLSKIASTA